MLFCPYPPPSIFSFYQWQLLACLKLLSNTNNWTLHPSGGHWSLPNTCLSPSPTVQMPLLISSEIFQYILISIPHKLSSEWIITIFHTAHYLSLLPIASTYFSLIFRTAHCLYLLLIAFTYCPLPFLLPFAYCHVKYSFTIINVKLSSTHYMKLLSITTSRKPWKELSAM